MCDCACVIVKCIYGGFEVRHRAKSCSNVNLSSPPDGCWENHTTVEKIQQESGEMLYYGYYQNKKAKYRTKGKGRHCYLGDIIFQFLAALAVLHW